MKTQLIVIASVLAMASLNSHASSEHWYGGFDIGQGYYSNGGNDEAYDSTRHRLAGGLHLGYQFNDYFSTEIAYQYLGKAYANYNDGDIKGTFQQGVLSGRLGYPITDNLYPYLKVGGAGWFGKTNGLTNEHAEGFSPAFGAGIAYAINDDLSLKMDYQFTQSIGDTQLQFSDHHLVTMGLSWKFGHVKKAVPATVIVEQPIIETFVISGFENNTLFALDSSELMSFKPLDNIVSYLQQYPTANASITGHTDNTGTEPYNLELSQHRAETIANYLITNGIDKTRLTITAMGELQPVADNSTSTGRAMNRRVELNITTVTPR
ncbi:outer membrane protein A [Shewanella sairae]|uniref:Outer membrane protein A n=1 Tax=Shewanella sairae TaxID=190310 RepID=A0ABQ4PLM5_9GAMM|nr:OmpA family protein [Shewanella sairae]MCL1131899.1 OmpA family protein [Shewanella sairae]GIU48885.1 outer membrane protein A [Shewanella sairae]